MRDNKGIRTVSSTFMYCWLFMRPSKMNISPTPLAVIQPQIIKLPTPCFAVDITHSGWFSLHITLPWILPYIALRRWFQITENKIKKESYNILIFITKSHLWRNEGYFMLYKSAYFNIRLIGSQNLWSILCSEMLMSTTPILAIILFLSAFSLVASL